MSFNPDDEESSVQKIERLRQENESLKTQVEDLTKKLAEYELGNVQPAQAAQAAHAAQAAQGGFSRQNSNRGRKSIPFERRNEQQHEGRMAYLLKKLGDGSNSAWNQDLIADLHAYCSRNQDFYRDVQEIIGAPNINLDTLIAMLQ